MREISDEEETALRERAAASSMSSLVLRTFLGAAALQRTLSLRTFRASEIELEITTLPKVRLYFAHLEP